MAKRILVPVVGDAEAVVPIVAAIAHDSGATVRLLRVMREPELHVGPYGRVIAYADQEMASLESRGLADLDVVKAQFCGIPVETVVRFGDPASEISREAEAFDADLIAVSSPHQGPFDRILGRDVAARTIRRATVPVLALHEAR